jgi:DNA-binding transcriptional MocR family regulator
VDTINFTRGVPANESFPLGEIIDAATTALTQNGTAMLQYGPAAGYQPLREWLASWQGDTPDRVLTGHGSLQLIEFLCLHTIRPGDLVYTESPTYDRTITLLRRHGARVAGIPLEADGPSIPALESALARDVCREGEGAAEGLRTQSVFCVATRRQGVPNHGEMPVAAPMRKKRVGRNRCRVLRYGD